MKFILSLSKGPSGNRPLLIVQPALHQAIHPAEWHRIGEVEVAARLDDREIHAQRALIRDDLLHPRHGEIAARPTHLHRLIIDDSVADTGLHPPEILRRKLVPLSRAVVVDRVRAMDEDAEGHC